MRKYTVDLSCAHGDEREEYAKSLIGLRYFHLRSFRWLGQSSYSARVDMVARVEVDKTVTYKADGSSQKVGFTRIYNQNGAWNTVEEFRSAVPMSESHKVEIIARCNKGILDAWGWTKDDQIAGFTELIKEIQEAGSDVLVLE